MKVVIPKLHLGNAFMTPFVRQYLLKQILEAEVCARSNPLAFLSIEARVTILTFIISRRALAREGDYEMMPVCACVRVCVR